VRRIRAVPNVDTRGSHDAVKSTGRDDQPVSMSVLIVDDHGDFRRSSRVLLEADGFRVVGEAVDGRQAVAQVRRLRPDVVLLDVMLPDLDGFAAAEEIAALDDPPVVVLVSSREASVYRARLSATTARGFLAKSQLSGAALARLVA